MSIPQVKSLYQSSAHINQPCASGSVSTGIPHSSAHRHCMHFICLHTWVGVERARMHVLHLVCRLPKEGNDNGSILPVPALLLDSSHEVSILGDRSQSTAVSYSVKPVGVDVFAVCRATRSATSLAHAPTTAPCRPSTAAASRWPWLHGPAPARPLCP